MSLTKRQKTLSAVFLIGLVALVTDRTILRPQGGPQAASADPLPAPIGGAGSSRATCPRRAADAARYRGATAEPACLRSGSRARGRCAIRSLCRPPGPILAPGREGRTTDASAGIRRRHQFRAVVGAGRAIGCPGGRQLSDPGTVPRRFHARLGRLSFRSVRARRPAGDAPSGGPIKG